MEEVRSGHDIMRERIVALIPDNPQIATMRNVWDLWNIPGFYCEDLQPTMHQMCRCLADAQHQWRRMEVEAMERWRSSLRRSGGLR